MIYFGFAPINLATLYRAFSMAVDESQPYLWVLECGFPYMSVMKGIIASNTLQSTGVVAWQSKYITLDAENMNREILVNLLKVFRSISVHKCKFINFYNLLYHLGKVLLTLSIGCTLIKIISPVCRSDEVSKVFDEAKKLNSDNIIKKWHYNSRFYPRCGH